MAKKRQAAEVDKGNWLDTYADMVTLLLCFFVLLYAASSVDETKWQYIYQSFTTSGAFVNPFVMDEQPDNNATESNGNAVSPPNPEHGGTTSEEIEGLPQDFNQLYSYLKTTVEENELSNFVHLERTETRIFIRFDNTIMFDGDSAVLKNEGKTILNKMMPGFKATNKIIKSCDVSGHTAQAVGQVNDWDLSAARASSVVKYMDYNGCIDSQKFTAEGKACYSPVADNDTPEGQARNRRVELVILENQLDTTSQAVIDDILKYEYRLKGGDTDPYDPDDDSNSSVDKEVVDQIVDGFDDKYGNDDDGDDGSENAQGPAYVPPLTGIPSDIIHDKPIAEETPSGGAPDEDGTDTQQTQ